MNIMGCSSCGSNNSNTSCTPQCKKYISCSPYSPDTSTEIFSCKYHELENNYPINRSKCVNYGTNPRYYSMPHQPCNCCQKCYPCQ